MAYDQSKDKMIKKFKQKTFGLVRLRLTAHQYGDGDAKLQITRLRRNDEESEDWKFTKLGRLNADEVTWISKRLKEIAKWMKAFDEDEVKAEE